MEVEVSASKDTEQYTKSNRNTHNEGTNDDDDIVELEQPPVKHELVTIDDTTVEEYPQPKPKSRPPLICQLCKSVNSHKTSQCPTLICKTCGVRGHAKFDCPQNMGK